MPAPTSSSHWFLDVGPMVGVGVGLNCKTNSTPIKERYNYYEYDHKPYCGISLSRYVHFVEDLEAIKLDLMPGFRFSWWYNINGVEFTPEPERKYANDGITKQFVR